jgi:hypothetical protein
MGKTNEVKTLIDSVFFLLGGGEYMSNKVYDILKYIAQIVLPAIGTLYFALAGIWGFPYGEQIVGTITAVDTFLGVVIGISSANYNKKTTLEELSEGKGEENE